MDEAGRPAEATAGWSASRPCQIQTNSDNRKGRYEDGIFHQASYTLLVELQTFPHKRIRIERGGEQLGEFDVISVIPLEAVGQTQIMV